MQELWLGSIQIHCCYTSKSNYSFKSAVSKVIIFVLSNKLFHHNIQEIHSTR
uniref:Uncharacterized protein n=1 Tax=Arundo donax TaxID=35708 RepID=A0A0A8Z401_ARUDO